MVPLAAKGSRGKKAIRRRTTFLVAVLVTAFVVASGVAWAATIGCPNRAGKVCVGTNKKDTMIGRKRADDMHARSGNDTLRARGGNDSLTGGPGNDFLQGAGGRDVIVGQTGNDSLGGTKGSDTYFFRNGWGVDTIFADTSGIDTLDFSALAPGVAVSLTPSLNNEAISGASRLNFSSTVVIEYVRGGRNRDYLSGNGAKNRLSGNDGPDSIFGQGGNDTLFGGLLDDYLAGGPGEDTLNAGEGNDRYVFGDSWGSDTITGDASGTDTLDFSILSSSMKVDLAATDSGIEASSGTNTLNFPSTVLIENARGGGAADHLYGNASTNSLDGRGGDDTIYGEDGGDTIYGGIGTDTVYGDNPNNSVTGNDTIDVADGDAGDTVDCGPDATMNGDTVDVDAVQDPSTGAIDPIDSATNCEMVNLRY
jgi:Ca2+-binding RTX toxin-like protein